MGGLFGDDDVESTVTYDIPPELRQIYAEIVQELEDLRPLIDQAVPDVQNAIQQYIQQYQDWLQRSPEYFEQAQKNLSDITSQTAQQLKNLFFGEKTSQPASSPINNITNIVRNEANRMKGMAGQIGVGNDNEIAQLIVVRDDFDNLLESEFQRRQAQGDPDPHESIMKEVKELGRKGFMQKYGGQASPSKSSQPTQSDINFSGGLMGLLNQYIQQAKGDIGQAWDEAIGRAGSYWDEAIGRAGSYWDEARQTLLKDIQEAEQKIPSYYEQARSQTKELTQQVLQDALRNTIRKMALQGLVSQTAGTQAMAEQFRQYEYEPLQRLIETEAEAKRKLQEQALGYKTDVSEKKAGTLSSMSGQKAGTLSSMSGQKAQDISSLISQGLQEKDTFLRDYASNIAKTQQTSMALQSGFAQQQLGFQLSLPEIYNAIMQAQKQYALTPFELRRSLLGTITGSAGALQQLSPANVTQSTSGGINPIFGGLMGTAGTLGLFKLFGII
jgi:hypothetical protein